MSVTIAGDSHILCLRAARPQAETSALEPLHIGFIGNGVRMAEPFFHFDGERFTFPNPDTRAFALRFFGAETLDPRRSLWWGLSAGLHTASVFSNPTWDTYAPAHLAAETGRKPLTTAAIEAMMLPRLTHAVAFAQAFQSAGRRVFAISAPPPHRRHRSLTDPASVRVRMAVDRFYREIAARECGKIGCPVVQPAAEAWDDDGFLRDDLRPAREVDQHHGGAALGAMMLSEINRFVDNAYRDVPLPRARKG